MGVEFGSGNQAARKYQQDDAVHIFRALLFYFEHLRPEAFFLNTGLNAFGYYPQLFYYLGQQFGDNEEIQVIAMRLASILEERLVVFGATGQIDKTMAIFLGKVKFGYVERQHIQLDGQDKRQATLDDYSEDQLMQLKNILLAGKNRDESGAEEVN